LSAVAVVAAAQETTVTGVPVVAAEDTPNGFTRTFRRLTLLFLCLSVPVAVVVLREIMTVWPVGKVSLAVQATLGVLVQAADRKV
jgi:hypothetical protein